jgi:hypothetical protein
LRDKNGRFIKGDPETAERGSKGGKIGGRAKVKKGFASNPTLASEAAIKSWKKRRANQN